MNQVPLSKELTQKRTPDTLRAFQFFSGAQLLTGLSLAALLGYVLVVLFGPIARGGDTYYAFSRLYIWTAALRAGDVLSTWTPVDANGFGSPVPFFYNKTFSLVGAPISLLSGDVIIAYRVAELFFSALLFAGVYACARRLTADRTSCIVISTLSLLAPYMIDQSIFNGSMAEFSGMALVPFIAALTLDMYRARLSVVRSAIFFALLLLLALTHVLVFAIVLGVLVPALFVLFVRAPSKAWVPLSLTVVAAALFAALIYVPFSYWKNDFCPEQAAIYKQPIANLLISPRDIFWRYYHSVFGWPFFALAILIPVTALRWRRIDDARVRTAFAIGCVVLAILFMMTHLSRPFWLISGPLEFIQFPYRLLAVAVPLCLIAVAGMIDQFEPPTRRALQFALLLCALFVTARLFDQYWLYNKMPAAELRREAPPGSTHGPDAGGEFLPANYRSQLATLVLVNASPTSFLPARRPLVEANGCSHDDIAPPAYFDRLVIHASCPSGGTLRVNQFSTAFLTADALDTQGRTLVPVNGNPVTVSQVSGTEPRFIDFSLPAGNWTITVRKRSYWELVELAWRAQMARLSH
ncbi:6-pyruvoyl-tetrahydropterin synthase-related protein [Paraburkholderia sp. J7]|uniref:6-pyruvoyl-tetrahydropterin synthase-related protein n=1 Tax=Paraburkholderia sp. J7 TaxID=2805438 RepID=UPI002AB6E850|nr:6-pyruvoyl-tetrahydropterin synthase-related protein [Paraburkholderia sp. J7]